MSAVESSVEINRPTADVFAFVADQTNAPRWQHGLHEVRRTTHGPIGVGTEHVVVRRFAGRPVTAANRYTHYEPGRYVAFEIPVGWVTGQASYLVAATDAGTSRLTARMDFRFGRLDALVGPVLSRVLARDARKNIAALKTLLEHPEPSAVTGIHPQPHGQ